MVTDLKSSELRMKLALVGIPHSGKSQILKDWASQQGDGEVLENRIGDSKVLRSSFRWSNLPRDGWSIHLQAYTTSGEVSHSSIEEMLLSEVDGIVFVAPVDGDRANEIKASLATLGGNLARHGRQLSGLPVVMHYHQSERIPGFDPVVLNDFLGVPTGVVPHVMTRSDDGSPLTASMAILLQVLKEKANQMLPAEEVPA